MQDRNDPEQEGMTGGMQDMMDTYKTEGIKDRRNAGHEECRT